MICDNCKKKVDSIDLYCLSCGIPTVNYKQHFNVKSILKKTSENVKNQETNYTFYYIGITIFLLAVLYLTHFNIVSENLFYNYAILNVSMIVFVPLYFLPLATISDSKKNTKRLRDSFNLYPKFALFVFVFILYLWVLKIICQGDPILNIVRFIMVLWGMAVVFPVPFLIINDEKNIFLLIYKAYIAGKYLRWQQFALCLFLGIINFLSVLLVLVPLPSALNYTNSVMYLWYKKQEEFQLYEKDKNY